MKIVESKKWYNDGIKEIQIDASTNPPEGFKPGRLAKMSIIMSQNRRNGTIPVWNKGIPASEHQKQTQSLAMRGKPSWNKGLTKETDPRVQQTADKLMGHKCFVTDWSIAKQKEYITKKANGTMNSSKPEEELYQKLCEIYGEDDVIHHYNSDIRYPFDCDIYIKSQDLFIELNYTWEHGGHPFDENSLADLEVLQKWQIKATDGKDRYLWAIKVWTERDPLKLETFRKNNLNFQIIYKDITITT